MEIEPITPENLAAQRRVCSKQLKGLLQQAASVPMQQEEKGLLAYVRKYIHPQATWLDCQRVLAQSLPEYIRAQQPLPWEYLSSKNSTARSIEISSPKELFRFHRVSKEYGWQMPENWSAILAAGLAQFQVSDIQIAFASGYDLPLIQQLNQSGVSTQLLSAHLPDAQWLAQQLPSNVNAVYWLNPWLLSKQENIHTRLFTPDKGWKSKLLQLPQQNPEYLYVNTLTSPFHRFERGNQRLFEDVDQQVITPLFGKDFLEGKVPQAAFGFRQLAWALAASQQKKKGVVAILPDACCWSPEWKAWRSWVHEHFAHQLLMREATGLWTACLLLPSEQPHLPKSQWVRLPQSAGPMHADASWEEMERTLEQGDEVPAHWDSLPWEKLIFHEGTWLPDQESPFIKGARLLNDPPSSKEKTSPKKTNQKSQHQSTPISILGEAIPLSANKFTHVNGLTREEAIQKMQAAQELSEEVVGGVEPSYIRPYILRYVWKETADARSGEEGGWYISRFPNGIIALDHPPQFPLFGSESEGYFVPKPQVSAEALRYFQEHYQSQVSMPLGLPMGQAKEWVRQLEKTGRQLPVLQKFINQLDELAQRFQSEIPIEGFEENREILHKFKKKIQQLNQGANERKKMFQLLLQILVCWEQSLNEVLKGREAAVEQRKAVNQENILAYIYAVLQDEEYASKYPLGLAYHLPRIPLYTDFWAWAKRGRQLLANDLMVSPSEYTPWHAEWHEHVPLSLPIFRLDAAKKELQVDAQLRLQDLPEHCFDALGKPQPWMKALLAAFRKKYLSPWNEKEWAKYRPQFLESLRLTILRQQFSTNIE